jgi:hypothetical protein
VRRRPFPVLGRRTVRDGFDAAAGRRVHRDVTRCSGGRSKVDRYDDAAGDDAAVAHSPGSSTAPELSSILWMRIHSSCSGS